MSELLSLMGLKAKLCSGMSEVSGTVRVCLKACDVTRFVTFITLSQLYNLVSERSFGV